METNQQYTNEFLSSKRLIGDSLVDRFIHEEFSNAERKIALYNWLNGLLTNTSLNQIPLGYHQEAFILEAQKLPVWADVKMMKAGTVFFVRHAEQIMQLLGLLSLPYCYAAADGAMVLYLSQRLKNETGKRLLETAGFIWDVMAPDAFEKDGRGFSSIFKIRLTHAAARYYTEKSGKWDANWGYPINQEDMAGTNLSFSLIVVRGLRKLGHTISYTEYESFLHLWNVIGLMLGVQNDLIPHNGKHAHDLELLIRTRQFKSSEQGRALTKALIETFNNLNLDTKISTKETLQLIRYLLGNEVADILGIPPLAMPLYLPYLLKIASNLPDLNSASTLQSAYQQKYFTFKQKSLMAV